ncbi:MAG: hypothetical protein NT105_09195 [Verrucomicrobia bacterium]|nr:hypothetical protein [Verrucomicrobiota bacterium]
MSMITDHAFQPRAVALVAIFLSLFAGTLGHATTLVVEAESLEATGGWQSVRETHGVRELLWSGMKAQPAPAVGAIELPKAGRWRLWVRGRDFPNDRPGIRNFTVRLGATRSAKVFGKHGQQGIEGWEWEDGGEFDLPAGPTLIVIGETSTAAARCDALLLTDSPNYQPKGLPHALGKATAKMAPLKMAAVAQNKNGGAGVVVAAVPAATPQRDGKALRETTASAGTADSTTVGARLLPEPLQRVEPEAVATLANDAVRWTFHRAATTGGPAIALQAALRDGGEWKPLRGDPGAEGYRMLFRPKESDPKIIATRVHPAWDISLSAEIEVSAGGASVKTRTGPPTAPWAAGQCFALRPIAARQVDSQTVELGLPPLPVGRLTATWRLGGSQSQAQVTLDFAPSRPGHFSLGYHSLVAATPKDVDFLLLPFMYHGKRFPAQPVTLLNSHTPTPLALVNRAGASLALVAEPAELPFEWAGPRNSRYAFGLRNETGQAQPLLYSPVLGQPDSVVTGSEPLRARFRVWLQAGNGYAAYRRVATEVFGLSDYRRPVYASVSDAALNLLDLIRDEKASGWDARAKGPWNIESRNVVSHSSPLTYLSYYLLTGDEDFYRRFALPALEFMISRPGAHFAAEREIGDNYYHHQTMRGPMSTYGAAVFASAFAMTHGRSPALGGFCLDDKGQPRVTKGYSHMQPFEDALALYRLTGEKCWRDAATEAADKYVAENITRLPTKDLGVMPFVNMSFVPDWEGLLHVYDATGERRFLDAAATAARWLVATLWTQPTVPAGETTIHPGGNYVSAAHVWWFGDKRYRRGFVEGAQQTTDEKAKFDLPPARLPEKRVPAWQVSNVGLGLEQPCTYTRPERHANITMNCWAPNLLRLAQLTGDELFRTAARNATIGRFGNYPGYYIDGMTDQYLRPDYPVAGPDVTWLYFHHIPPFAAYVLDYLFTDAETRSKGTVSFPSVRQCGYVWFDNRLRGHAPGKVYGQPAWPWLHRTAATVDTINVDRVLAHGGGKFHVVLLNQIREEQTVRVKFDPQVFGRAVDGAKVSLRLDNKPAPPLRLKDGAVSLKLKPLGIAVLTLDGVKVDVPTHRAAPPAKLSLPGDNGLRRQPVAGAKLEAIGTEICVPPFTWRDLYVYIAAGFDDCKSATLRYRVGSGAEQQVKVTRFPWEFSVRVDDMRLPITWSVEVQTGNSDDHSRR